LNSNVDGVTLRIRDNGRGFDSQQVFSSYGLRGMKERLDMHQGQLLIETQPGQGCEIIAQIVHQKHSQLNHIPNVGCVVPQGNASPESPNPPIGPWVSFSLDSWSF
jgi:hypothetical protein